jgi:glucose-6-phosphate 1-dehydrogenase
MKMITLLITAVLICNTVSAQKDSSLCVNYRQGFFSYTDTLGYTVLVERQKKYQYEKNIVTKVKTQFRITWINDCSYEIFQTMTNSKAARKYKYTTTKVIIEKPDGNNGYKYSCGCPGAEKDKGYMKKLSQKAYFGLY